MENPFYLTKDQQSYLAEIMGLDYALRIEDTHHETAIELLRHVCEAVGNETWSTRIRIMAHAILDSCDLQT